MRYVPGAVARLAQGAPVPTKPECPPVTKTEAAAVMSGLLVFGAGSAWVGMATGRRETGVLSVVGWGVGILGVAVGALGLSCLVKLAAGTWEPGASK